MHSLANVTCTLLTSLTWQPWCEALFDLCVVDTDTWFHDVLNAAKEEKKLKYG